MENDIVSQIQMLEKQQNCLPIFIKFLTVKTPDDDSYTVKVTNLPLYFATHQPVTGFYKPITRMIDYDE